MSSEWFYSKGQQQVGPVSSSELKKLASDGGLQQSDLVWKNGMSEWKSAGSIKGLFKDAVPASPPPIASKTAADKSKPSRFRILKIAGATIGLVVVLFIGFALVQEMMGASREQREMEARQRRMIKGQEEFNKRLLESVK